MHKDGNVLVVRCDVFISILKRVVLAKEGSAIVGGEGFVVEEGGERGEGKGEGSLEKR